VVGRIEMGIGVSYRWGVTLVVVVVVVVVGEELEGSGGMGLVRQRM